MEALVKQVLDRAEALLNQKSSIVVALDGRCATGKTTLAGKLTAGTGWKVVHMDDFFLRPEQRTPERLAEPGGNVDYERFLKEVLIPLKEGSPISYRPYDCQTQSLLAPIPLIPGPVTLVEGSYSCHPKLREHYDLRIFLTVSQEEQSRRIQIRNRERAEMFFQKWIPLEERYFSLCQVEECCQLSLRGEGLNN